ncbi:hypothetical protein D7D52_18630 [Nocardia yunnanensis]|uniref:Uncharacterized protein n=1 Tax=Nocardia yunnanensis TaxID=2382165 RepID=A0A386ZEC2_9NOCA|nr:hypothetical protein [Nocardia yunnanensis]AYF75533.1 hypothetical protein D7D52_18630 [Nocardia yunnanensis]
MSITLTAQDQATVRTAAYGAISLLAAASAKPHQVATNGSKALMTATGPIGHVLAAKVKDIHLSGKSTAQLADQVLPALTTAMTVLTHQDPAEAANFRTTVLIALATDHPTPATTEMTRKITAALDAA